MSKILYSNGDSIVWGAELENKKSERFSSLLSNAMKWIDCNNASAGVSNDYVYRQTIRDISHWISTKECWSEETGWVKSDSIFVLLGWTAPTRFEWWNGTEYQQERLWVGYDKWGDTDEDKTTEDKFVLNQTSIIPSYIKTFNMILSLSSFLDNHKIPYHFFNSFYKYDLNIEESSKIDKFGRPTNQYGIENMWNMLPQEFKKHTMYDYISLNNGDFLERNHPSPKSHKIWSDYLIKEIRSEK